VFIQVSLRNKELFLLRPIKYQLLIMCKTNKVFIAVLLLLLITIGAKTQSDSLKLLLPETKGTARIDLLVKIAKQLWYSDPNESLGFAYEALQLSELSNNKEQQTHALNAIGGSYYFKSVPDSAIHFWRSSLLLSEQIRYSKGIAKASNNLGIAYQYIGDYDMAVQYYYISLEEEQKNDNQDGIATAFMNLGNVYFYLSDFDKSLEYATNALELSQKLKNDLGILKCYNNIGSIYTELGFYDNALSYSQNAYELSLELENEDHESSTLNNLGKIYFGKKEFEKSIKHYELALKLAAKNDDFWSQANTVRNIGGVYLEQGNLEKAKMYFEQSIVVSTNIQATYLLSDLYNDISQVYELEFNFEKALAFHKLHTTLKDSLFNDESRNKIARTEVAYKLKYKDQLLDFARQKNEVSGLKIKTQKYLLYALASFSLFLFSLFLIFYLRARANKKANKIQKVKNRKISDQKILLEKTVSELKESETKYKALVNSIQDGLFIIQDKKLIYANATLPEIMGYKSHDELLELNPDQIIAAEDLKKIVQNHDDRIEGKEVPSNYEFKLIHKSGKPVDVAFCAKKVNVHGKPAIIGTIKEISSAKKYEAKLIEEKERAEKATQSKSYFLAGISHEIRNQMNSISGIADVLSETELSNEQKEYVDILKLSGNNLLNIINEVLDLSKIEAGQIDLDYKPFELRKLIKEIVAMHGLAAKQIKISLNFTIDDLIPDFLLGDSVRLSQILINLVGNALKFTDKGSITIAIDLIKQTKTNCFLKFAVIDTGVGISEDSQSKLFRPFSQTHVALERGQKGTGLGLAISKQLATLMQGDIGVMSEVGKGSTFWFTADFQIAVKASKEKTENGDLSAIVNNGKILLIEDNPVNIHLTLNILKREGFKADVAENGKIGVDLFKANCYQIVLMDIQMPVMDGIEATRLIRQHELKKKLLKSTIIAITAHAKEGEKVNLFEAGMDHYISKPFKPNELLNLIKNLN